MIKLKQKYLTTRIGKPCKELFCKINNRGILNKPNGGMWSSPYNFSDEYESDWVRWCYKERYDNPIDGYIFSLKDGARVCTIDCFANLDNLFEEFELEGVGGFTQLDYEKLAKKYDAILVTANGLRECRWHHPTKNLYTWDVESLLVMNFDIIEEIEYVELNVNYL